MNKKKFKTKSPGISATPIELRTSPFWKKYYLFVAILTIVIWSLGMMFPEYIAIFAFIVLLFIVFGILYSRFKS